MSRPSPKPLDRRTFLQGTSAMIALPFLEAMMPERAWSQTNFPKRLGIFCFPFGTHEQAWAPTTYGTSFTIPANLSAISNFKNRVILTRGLGAHGLPQGSHMASAPYFTTEPLDGCQFKVRSKSVDMIISDYLRQQNPSLVPLVTKPEDSVGFSGCYNHVNWSWEASINTYLSWTSQTSVASQITTPQAVFDKLFAGTSSGGSTDPFSDFRRARGKSVLDNVLGQATSIKSKVGTEDQKKLDQYFNSIREVERTMASITPPTGGTTSCNPGTRPGAISGHDKITTAFLDLAVLAMACDRSRVVTHLLDSESELHRSFPWLGIDSSAGHHLISHTDTSEGGIAPSQKPGLYLKITAWYADRLAYLLDKMQSYQEGDKDLLYNSVIVYGSGMGPTGASHSQYDLSLVIAGELGGTIRTGQAINASGTRMANLWLAIMQRFGVQATSYASSTDVLKLS